jgi:hypothetical protein
MEHDQKHTIAAANGCSRRGNWSLAATRAAGDVAPKADNDRELGSTTDELAMNVIVQSSKDR